MPTSVGDPNAGQGQALVAPVRDRAYWTNVIHNAAKVTPDNPRYGEARQVAQIAIQGLQDLADTAGEKDIKAISPGKLGTAAVAFGHGASLGLAGDPTYLALARQANPKTAFVSDVAGSAALAGIASPAVAELSPVTQGIILGGGLGAARGAIEPIPGFSRGESAALTGAGGAVTGAVISKFASKFVPTVRTIWTNIARMLGPKAAPAEVAQVAEGAIRARLTALKVRPDIIEQAIESWKANGTLSVKGPSGPPVIKPVPEPPPPPTVRPGETIQPTPNLDKATFLRRGGTVRQDTSPISGNRSMSFDPGKGQTLPWYPRGGAVEQGVAPLPTTTVPTQSQLGQNQMAVFLDYLKQATTPQDALARLGTLRDLGIPTPGDPAQVLSLLFGAPR